MVRGSNTLSIGGRSSVVEVDLRSSHVTNRGSKLLAGSLPVSGTSHTNHPDKEDEHNDKEDSSSNTSGNVGELRLLGTLESSEGAGTLTVGFSFLVLQTNATVPAEPVTFVKATVWTEPSSIVTKLALTIEIIWRLEQTDGILVTQLLSSVLSQTSVGALTPAGGPHLAQGIIVGSAGVGGTVIA